MIDFKGMQFPKAVILHAVFFGSVANFSVADN